MNTSPGVRRVPLEPASAESLAAFGRILGGGDAPSFLAAPFYGDAVSTSRPAEYRCEGATELSLARINPRPPQVQFFERHFRHTQAFIPLGGKPFVLLMAPPGDAALPDLDRVRAFQFDGSTGFVMHLGTWHEFPFALEPETDVIVVLSSQTVKDLQNTSAGGREAGGPDLQKLDIVARTGAQLEFEPAAGLNN